VCRSRIPKGRAGFIVASLHGVVALRAAGYMLLHPYIEFFRCRFRSRRRRLRFGPPLPDRKPVDQQVPPPPSARREFGAVNSCAVPPIDFVDFGLAPLRPRQIKGHRRRIRATRQSPGILPAQRPENTIRKSVAKLALCILGLTRINSHNVGDDLRQCLPIRPLSLGT
jgi:hypothetical protein